MQIKTPAYIFIKGNIKGAVYASMCLIGVRMPHNLYRLLSSNKENIRYLNKGLKSIPAEIKDVYVRNGTPKSGDFLCQTVTQGAKNLIRFILKKTKLLNSRSQGI